MQQDGFPMSNVDVAIKLDREERLAMMDGVK
jgi:hypothetical protein